MTTIFQEKNCWVSYGRLQGTRWPICLPLIKQINHQVEEQISLMQQKRFRLPSFADMFIILSAIHSSPLH